MKRVFIILFVIFAGCTSQDNFFIKTVVSPKNPISNVAVIPENWDSYWVSSFAYRSLITELMFAGFNVVERSNLFTIINEQKLQLSGLVKKEDKYKENYEFNTLDRITIAKLGEALGADMLLIVYTVPSGRKLNMATIRLVDVETASVLTSTTIVTPDNGEYADVIMKQVATDIAEAYKTHSNIIRENLFSNIPDSW